MLPTRRIAALEGAEMVSDDAEDQPFSLPEGAACADSTLLLYKSYCLLCIVHLQNCGRPGAAGFEHDAPCSQRGISCMA